MSKAFAPSAVTGRLYLSTLTRLYCLDLKTNKPVWDIAPPGGCDRMAITPDGKTLYVPSLEGPHWNIVAAASGEIVGKIEPKSGRAQHRVQLGWDARLLRRPAFAAVGRRGHGEPKSHRHRRALQRGDSALHRERKADACFATVNGLLGFEIGDLASGKMIERVEVKGYKQGPVQRHGCPSHGIGLSPDEREVWVCDSANRCLHIFDATVMPPKQMQTVRLTDEPGWVTFSIDGRFAYPSTGEIIDARTKKIVGQLTDEQGRHVESEKLLEIDFRDGAVVRAGDQFGIGRLGQ